MSDFLQLHFLTAYPPSNLNRDDLGRPKTALYGGTQRLRISSQSIKRAWRTSDALRDQLEGALGTRTKDVGNWVYDELVAKKVDPERADAVAKKVAEVFGKLKGAAKDAPKDEGATTKTAAKKKGREKKEAGGQTARQIEQLAHLSTEELARIRALIGAVAKGDVPSDASYANLLGSGHGTVDIALFGRMLADASNRNVEAAAQVAHPITIHKVAVEDDFFTAVDDLNRGEEDRGAGHMGSTEFGSGIFYGYVCVDRALLLENLDGNRELASRALTALARAVATVSPTGKQNSFAARSFASYMLAERGSQQPRSLALSFLEAVEGKKLLEEGIGRLEKTRAAMEQIYGPSATETSRFNVATGEGSLEEVARFAGAF